MFAHNVEAEIWRRHAETKTRAVPRLLYSVQHKRMRRYEADALKRFDGVLAVSDADRETFARLYPGQVRGPVHVVPTGVDTEYFAPAPDPASRELVFTGSMDWLPNEDAMLYFCREILPLVRKAEPEVRLTIVGRAPTPAVTRLAAEDSRVAVTGRVDDVRPYIRRAAVYVVPLRIGGGTRLKIFEAMAMGKAVVSTTIGAEGLDVEDGTHVRLADDPERFAAAVIDLIRHQPRREALGTAARALVAGRYDWGAVAGDMERALCALARVA
jgi:glycosyltransferase involved in cell wall biosynthesis